MYRAYKFRLYPTPKQKSDLNQNFGNCRFVFNHYLSIIKDDKFTNVSNYINDFNNKLKIENQFLQKTDSQILIKSIYHLNDSYKNYYQNKVCISKYKSKYAKNSYTIKNSYINYQTNHQIIELDLENKTITLSNLEKIKIKGYRKIKKITGKIVNATISKEPTGKYYVSILFEQPNLPKENFPTSIVGIDLGIKKLLTLSNGITYDNNKYIEKYEKRIKRCQKELSRKEKGSKNYYKCKKKLAIIYSKLKNARKYHIHKITKNITNNYDIIVCEKLQTKQMITKGKLSKKITDASFQEIIRQLEYKCRWKYKQFYQIDTYYPSSQTCCICGKIDKTYKDLSKRTYNCTNCYNNLDRDFNASINIMFEGLRLYINKTYKNYKNNLS